MASLRTRAQEVALEEQADEASPVRVGRGRAPGRRGEAVSTVLVSGDLRVPELEALTAELTRVFDR